MALQGNLQDMAVADLIQHNCRDKKTAQLTIKHNGYQAALFFKDGAVVHAALNNQQGEEVIFNILDWRDGQFSLETGIEAPATTIQRSWSGLLLEGARRLDESHHQNNQSVHSSQMEVNQMAQDLDAMLKELGGQVDGFLASAVVGMDGLGIAQYAATKKADMDKINAQITMLVKLVDTTVTKLGAGVVEDNLLTTETALILIKFLADKSYFLGIAADRKTAKLGNMRLISRIFAERVAQAMPH